MKRLLFALTLIAGTRSLHSMEVPKQLPPITLPQIYQHLSELLNRDVAQYIFSLQPGTNQINEKISLRRTRKEGEMNPIIEKLKMDIHLRRHYCYGHCLTVEVLKRNLLRKNMSICEITDNYNNETVLHSVADDSSTKHAKLFLEVAGIKLWTLLTTQNTPANQTALHFAAYCGQIDFVKLLLNAAGNKVQGFMNIRDHYDKTAFDIATPEVQEIMKQYL